MAKMKWYDWVAILLVSVGAVNWGLIGINSNYNIVATLLGKWPMILRAVYGLVGLSGVYSLIFAIKQAIK
jgi:uncharacterized protein